MALTGKITTFFSDKAQTKPMFPFTKTKAVSNDDGVILDTLLNEINEKFAGCFISFTDEDGNPTDEPYIHYAVDEDGNPVYTGLSYVEEGEF